MKNKKESGVVVVEAAIVVTLVMILITIMLFVGITLYQQTLVSVMANQTASNIAQVYSNNLKDPFTGYINPDKVYQSVTYGNMKTDAYIDVIEKKANVFSKYRLKSSRMLANSNTTVEVELVKKPNELLKSQVVVTIHDKVDVPLVGMFNTNGLIEFESTGRADCVDILEYINGVEAVGDPENSNIGSLPDVSTCTITFIPDRSNPSDCTVVPVLKGKSVMSSNKYTHSVMPKTPTKGTLDFDGWVTQENRNFTATTQIENNMIVYGSWKCDVVLNAEGGKVYSQDKYTLKVKEGYRANLPNPSRPGYNFAGWYTEKGGKGTRCLSNDTIFNEPITLYAHWSCLHVDGNGRSKISLIERNQYLCQDVGGAAQSYELYKCTACSYSYKITIDNKHYIDPDYRVNTHELLGLDKNKNDFTAQCNVNHLSKSQSQVSGSYGSGFSEGVSVKHNYHITCRHCGMHMPKVWWDNINGRHVYKEMYWTSNVSWRTNTLCRTPDARFN